MKLSRNKISKLLKGKKQSLKLRKHKSRGSRKIKRTFRKKRPLDLRNRTIKKGGDQTRKKLEKARKAKTEAERKKLKQQKKTAAKKATKTTPTTSTAIVPVKKDKTTDEKKQPSEVKPSTAIVPVKKTDAKKPTKTTSVIVPQVELPTPQSQLPTIKSSPTISGCRSAEKEPENNCDTYKQQALLFHPDKNLTCIEEANKKFQKLKGFCPEGKDIKKEGKSSQDDTTKAPLAITAAPAKSDESKKPETILEAKPAPSAETQEELAEKQKQAEQDLIAAEEAAKKRQQILPGTAAVTPLSTDEPTPPLPEVAPAPKPPQVDTTDDPPQDSSGFGIAVPAVPVSAPLPTETAPAQGETTGDPSQYPSESVGTDELAVPVSAPLPTETPETAPVSPSSEEQPLPSQQPAQQPAQQPPSEEPPPPYEEAIQSDDGPVSTSTTMQKKPTGETEIVVRIIMPENAAHSVSAPGGMSTESTLGQLERQIKSRKSGGSKKHSRKRTHKKSSKHTRKH